MLKEDLILVTGGAGLIGFNLVAKLNKLGYNNIIIADNLNHEGKEKNLAKLTFTKYLDKKELLNELDSLGNLRVVFHQGACSSTTETNWAYLQENNIQYSKDLLQYCTSHQIDFIYASSASVYGDGSKGFDDSNNDYMPINGYAQSKLEFDKFVTEQLSQHSYKSKVIGLRYFNVYGYGEAHKQHMSSVLYKFYKAYKQDQPIELFEGSDKILRDFIFVDDVVAVNLFAATEPIKNDIYNVGTGKAQSFQDVANAFCQYFNDAVIKNIPFPKHLLGKYQYFTEAKMDKLLQQGYKNPFTTVEEGVNLYLKALENE